MFDSPSDLVDDVLTWLMILMSMDTLSDIHKVKLKLLRKHILIYERLIDL